MRVSIEIRSDFMNSTGAKIKNLRTQAKLSQAQFAERIGSTTKSVQRYESGKCYPETYTLMKIAKLFGVPTDFLLESDTMNILEANESENGLYRLYYKRYSQCKNNYCIDENAEYYWIYLDDDGTFGGQSEWVDWADKDRKIEVRQLRLVVPQKAIDACTYSFGPPMVINDEAEVEVFLLFGGHAIINADICRKYLPTFHEVYIGPNPERWLDSLLAKL